MPISTALAFIAALIGAGFASGREIQLFFARFGAWGLLFSVLCGLELFILTTTLLRVCRQFQARSVPELCARVAPAWCATLCQALLVLLLWASSGAMLCTGGELFSLLFPLHVAYPLGFALTLLWGVLLALHSLRALGLLGGVLIPLMAVLFLLLGHLEPAHVLSVAPQPSIGFGLLIAASYAPLNLVLSSGVICESAQALPARSRRTTALVFALGASGLLLSGTSVLLHHQGQIQSAMLPFVVLSARLGKPGYYVCAVILYLAVLSTLTALLRAQYALIFPYVKQRAGRVLTTLACTLCALMGFDHLIGIAYPALGVLCTAMLLFVLLRASIHHTSER